jgi:hypothetical protein
MEYMTQTLTEELTIGDVNNRFIDPILGKSNPGNYALEPVISLFPKISLEEMASVKLMNRTDTKYLVQTTKIPLLLNKAIGDYQIQEIKGEKVAKYGTLYLDTEELNLFRTHMNGKLNRLKWRIRSYIGSDLSFLEIKKKINSGQTQKKRIEYIPSEGHSGEIATEFIWNASGMKADNLKPVIQNSFNRITLVNNGKTERLTIDFNIAFKNFKNGKISDVTNLAIIEIKQDRSNKSAMHHYLNELRIKKSGISKYCLGIVLTDKTIKGNSYKKKIRSINKITAQR